MPAATVSVSSTTAQQVWALITALTGHTNDQGACAWLSIRGDDGNSTNNIWVGDAGVSSSNYAFQLGSGVSITYPSPGGGGPNNVSLTDKWLKASTTSLKANLEWEYA